MLSRRGFLIGAGGITATVALAACGNGGGQPAAAGGPWSFTDDRNQKVSRDQRPTRVVAYASSAAALAKSGVDPKIALDVINASSGRSNTSMNLFPERVLSRAFPRTFRLALLDKDVGIAADVAREQKIASPMLQLTAELFRLAHGELGEEADHVEAVKLVEKWAGTEIS